MENSFGTIRENSSLHRIQLEITSFIPMLLLFYDSKKPVFYIKIILQPINWIQCSNLEARTAGYEVQTLSMVQREEVSRQRAIILGCTDDRFSLFLLSSPLHQKTSVSAYRRLSCTTVHALITHRNKNNCSIGLTHYWVVLPADINTTLPLADLRSR
jgi:hypothetical protein